MKHDNYSNYHGTGFPFNFNFKQWNHKGKKHFVQGHLHISDTLCQNIYCEVWNLRYFTSNISAFVQTSIICLTERNAMAQWGFIIRTKH